MDINIVKSKGNLGIDIGTSSVKVVEVEKRGNRFALGNYGIFESKGASPHFLKNNNDGVLKLPDQEIADGIKSIIKHAKMGSVNVIASIPSFFTFATVIEMPYISNEDLARAIPYEAKKYIPIPISEVVLDWSIVGVSDGTNQAEKPANVEIFLAAVPKEETIRYQNIMETAGLKLKALELENSALIRALLGNDLSPTAIVNIGGRSTSIIIVDRGYERVSHSYEVGGFEITAAISRSLNVGLEKAEELKKKFGLRKSQDNLIGEAIIPLIDTMAFETVKTILSYEETRKDHKITNILLVGGLSNMPGFVEYFKEKTSRNAASGNPLSRFIYPEELNAISSELNSVLAVALGLGSREL